MSTTIKYAFVAISFAFLLLTSCKTTKQIDQNPVSYEELYKVWQIDSLNLGGTPVPDFHSSGATLTFKKDGKAVSTMNGQTTTSNYELKGNTVLNLDKPEEPALIIEKLNKAQLTLLSHGPDGGERRLFLSSKNK